MMVSPIVIGGSMKTTRDWQAQAKGIIRGELKRRNLSYKDLAERLQAIGVKDTEKNVVNKIARGGFTAAFFLQCMEAIGVQNIHLNGD
jgi:3-mercaptopyruvate sulfurtransferase SseA